MSNSAENRFQQEVQRVCLEAGNEGLYLMLVSNDARDAPATLVFFPRPVLNQKKKILIRLKLFYLHVQETLAVVHKTNERIVSVHARISAVLKEATAVLESRATGGQAAADRQEEEEEEEGLWDRKKALWFKKLDEIEPRGETLFLVLAVKGVIEAAGKRWEMRGN